MQKVKFFLAKWAGRVPGLIPEDPGVFYLQESGGNRLACTNPVQTYVDLWHCGGRGQEAVEALLEQKIKPAWKLKVPA